MKFLPLVSLFIASGAMAQPAKLSQHPRVGELAEIAFTPGSARFAALDEAKLGLVAAWALDHPNGLVVLDAHAARTKSPPADVGLSLKRAEVIRDQLVALGVGQDQVVIAAYGSDDKHGGPSRNVVVWGTKSGINDVIRARSDAVAIVWGTRPLPANVATL